MTPQQRQNEKRRNKPRLSPQFVSEDTIRMLAELEIVYGSKRAAIEEAIKKLHEEQNK